MLGDYLVSLIRTWVPVLAGAVISWAVTQGLSITPATKSSLIVGLTGIFIAGYYALARALELRYKWAGLLLGVRKAPSYPGGGK
jgi:hypothetical protein